MARRNFLYEILHRAGKYFDKEGGVFTPSSGKGNPNIGTVTRTVKDVGSSLTLEGKVYEFDAELIYKGNEVVGWKATSAPRLLRTIKYVSGGGRLNNGFDSLMTELQISGASSEEILRLRDKWKSLTDNQKADVWSAYRKWCEDNGYGSYPRADTLSPGEIDDYTEIIDTLIDEVIGE